MIFDGGGSSLIEVHLGWERKSSQHLDRSGVRVSTSEGGSRVNTSTGTESESAPRKAEVESTPRPERSPSQHLGRRKSSQHLDRKVQDFESAPRNVGRMVLLSNQLLERLGKEMVPTVETGRLIYPGAAYGPSGIDVWGAVVCALRYTRAIGG